MAKKVTTVRTFEDAGDPPERHIEAPVDPSEISYGEFVKGLPNTKGCLVKVHRKTDRGRLFCFQEPPENIESEETIRRYHASKPFRSEEGVYTLSVYVNGELYSTHTVLVDAQAAPAGGPSEAAAPSGGMADIIRMQQEQIARLEARILQGEKTPIVEMVQAMAQLDQMRNGGGQQTSADTLLKAIELGGKLGGGGGAAPGGWDTLLPDLIKENAPVLLGLLKGFGMKAPAVPPPENPAPQQIQENPPMEDDVLKRASEFMALLKRKAMNQSDPTIYIDLIVDNREDPMYARLISEIVNNEFSAFVAMDADLAKPPYAEFFRAIYDGIRRLFVPKDTVAKHSGGKGGHAANAPSNGAVSKNGSK